MHKKHSKLTIAAILIFSGFVGASIFLAHLPNKDINIRSPFIFAAFGFLVLARVFFFLLRTLTLGSEVKQGILKNPKRARDLVVYIVITFLLLCAGSYIWLRANHYVS